MNIQFFICCLFGIVSSEIIWKNLFNYNTNGDRIYYIACVEEEWNYTPTGYNIISNTIIANDQANLWFGSSDNRIGSTYIKAVYRQYIDKNFNKQIPRSSEWKHLGVLGPLIRGIVGEKIKIFYKNMCSFNTSMHPHGLLYDKFSEGSLYFNNNNNINNGNIVAPNAGWIYIWTVRANAIDRTPNYSSKLWLYHSHVDEIGDIAAGLVGPIIITKKQKEISISDPRPRDIDREFISYFILFNENGSPLFNKNVENYLNITDINSLIQDEEFIESNLMHSINGYSFGNCVDCYNMIKNEKVRWYVASLGNELDGPHSPHWHANVLFDHDEAVDTVNIIPATTKTLDMIPDITGTWLFHCHVFDHIEAGMSTLYKVV